MLSGLAHLALHQTVAQIGLCANKDGYEPPLYMLPRQLGEKLEPLRLEKVGVKLTTLTEGRWAS